MNSTEMFSHEDPIFSFDPPVGYKWLRDRKLVGYEPQSQLQPWYYLDTKSIFDVTRKWPHATRWKDDLVAFAKRQDCDDIACFSVQAEKVNAIVVVHGWTGDGYEIVDTYESFWDWLKSVVDDVASWVEG